MTDHVLYRMFDAADELLYVGRTIRPVARLRTHSKDKMWWSQVATIRLQAFETRPALELAEKAAIRDESPRFNIVLNGLPRTRTYSLEQAAEEICGDGSDKWVRWLTRQIKSGRASARKTKGKWRMSSADIEALIDACSNHAAVEAYQRRTLRRPA